MTLIVHTDFILYLGGLKVGDKDEEVKGSGVSGVSSSAL